MSNTTDGMGEPGSGLDIAKFSHSFFVAAEDIDEQGHADRAQALGGRAVDVLRDRRVEHAAAVVLVIRAVTTLWDAATRIPAEVAGVIESIGLLAGGIAAKNIAFFTDGRFLAAFTRKGRFSDLVRTMPVDHVVDETVGLIGAVEHARRN